MPVQKELKQHGKLLKQQGELLNQQGKLLISLKKDQDTMLSLLDGEQTQQRKRLKRIEAHLELH